MRCVIRNETRATRIFHSVKGRPIEVPPGKEVPADLTVEELRRAQRRPGVKARRSSDRPFVTDDADVTTGDTDKIEGTSDETTVIEDDRPRSVQAQELLDEYATGGVEYHDWLAKAKPFLGEKWPGGTPKKSVVLELLDQEVKAGEQE